MSPNTVNCKVIVNPSVVPGDHDVFVSGNDSDAKAKVAEMLKSWFGWNSVIDLGDVTTARGTETLLPIWIRLWGLFQTEAFNLRIAKRPP